MQNVHPTVRQFVAPFAPPPATPEEIEALRGHWPLIAPGTPPDEAQRLAADLYNMQHKERLRQERALALQIQYGDAQ